MLFAQLTPTRDSTSELSSTRRGTVKLLFLVTAPRGKPERQMKEMEHRSATFFSGESRIVEQQKEQHSTSSTSQTPSAPRHPEIFYVLAPRHPEIFYMLAPRHPETFYMLESLER